MRTLTDLEVTTLSADISRGGWEVRGTALNDADVISENEQIQIFIRAKMVDDWDLVWIKRFV